MTPIAVPINFTVLLTMFSVPLVALIRKCHWPDIVVFLLAVTAVTGCYTAGRGLDGALTWPLGQEFAQGLGNALLGQQILYQLTKETTPIQQLEAFGNDVSTQAALVDGPRRRRTAAEWDAELNDAQQAIANLGKGQP